MVFFDAEIYLRFIVSLIIGLIIGYERTINNKPAGVRTFALVSLGSTLFTVVSINAAEILNFEGVYDPLRVAAQIVSGIGFIGAGVIWNSRNGGMKHGITTAAELWVTSAIGMSLGLGVYDLAIVVTICILIAIFIGRRLDDYVEEKELKKDA
ncbi:MAG: MgtC/SapB family protein [Firmicutes bacterium]|nr:MgtC/SapB family protein [Bacillota bacterium]